MTKINIDTISMLPRGMLNAFLVTHGTDAVLIDTGLPDSAPKIARALARRNMGLGNLRLIVLTHGHIDHAGSAKAVADLSGAPVLAHVDEMPYLTGTPPLLRPSGLFGRFFKQTGLINQPFPRVTPDIQMDGDDMDLSDFGLPARVLRTPGHTPGSISVLMDDGRVFAGDLAASGIALGGLILRGRPKSPPFEEDRAAVATSLDRLISLGGREFLLGHGGPLPASAIKSHIANLT